MRTFYLAILSGLGMVTNAQDSDRNFVKSVTYKTATTTVNPLPDPQVADVEISYFDGLGRLQQKILRGKSGTDQNIVIHSEFDQYGREAKVYLPAADSGTSLNFIPNAKTFVEGFYTGFREGTTNPYTENVYEKSPLNRIIRTAAPGNPWAVNPTGGTDRSVKTEYSFSGPDEVRFFNVVTNLNDGVYEPALNISGHYKEAELRKVTTKDENWYSGKLHTTETFTDAHGRMVLKRTYASVDGQLTAHDTYYVYDKYGNLTFVIPPKVTISQNLSQTVLDDLCYQYKYDHRHRLVEKKLPGRRWEYVVYNKLDRPVAHGPVPHPLGLDQLGWIITKYDVHGREIYTGWKADNFSASSRKTMQDWTNGFSAHQLYEEYDGQAVIDGFQTPYSNNHFVTNLFLLSVNYYDHYNFQNPPSGFTTPQGQNAYYDNTKAPRGLATGNWRRILQSGATVGETRFDLFDDKARSIYHYKKNHLGGYTAVETFYHFDGRPVRKITSHSLSGTAPVTTSEDYEYRESGLINKVNHSVNHTMSNEVTFEYDVLGQNIQKNIAENGTTYQQVDFSYNIRGWLTGINDIDDLESSASSPPDLFAFQINYYDDDPENQNQPLYNGNISTTSWKSYSDNIHRQYHYYYDGLNRLLNARFYKQHQEYNSYNEQLSYDKNGNIQTILRNGGVEDVNYNITIDNLAFTYAQNSNLLTKVIDLSNNPQGFDERADGDSNAVNDINDDYTYDDFGNMTSDTNKGVTEINYNHLHLPVTVQVYSSVPGTPTGGFGGPPPPIITEGEIRYIYNADGVKVSKIVDKSQAPLIGVYYQDGFQYTNEKLEFFPHAEGYVNALKDPNSDFYHFNYVYQYKDHLGNIRVNYAHDPLTGQMAILSEDHYYPFGLKHRNYNMTWQDYKLSGGSVGIGVVAAEKNKYKYNGMEWQDDLSLNWYDYHARNYDPAIGRWMNVDPLAENSRRWTPYNYAYNNPVFFVDPDGMQAESSNITAETEFEVDAGYGRKVTGRNNIMSMSTSGIDLGFAQNGEKFDKMYRAAYSSVVKQNTDLDAFAKKEFGGDYKEKFNVNSIKWGSELPKKGIETQGGLVKYNSKDELIYVGKSPAGGVTIGGNSIYISDTFARYPSVYLKGTMGHEFVHTYHHNRFGKNYNSSYSEFSAYQYSIDFSKKHNFDESMIKQFQEAQTKYKEGPSAYNYKDIPGL